MAAKKKSRIGIIWYLLCLGAMIFSGRYLLNQEYSWTLTYLFLGLWVTYGILALLNETKAADIGCIGGLWIYGAVYILQAIGYVYYRGFHWMLLLPAIVATAVALLALGRWALDRLPKECAECWKPAPYMLIRKGRESKWLCREHFRAEVHEALAAYKGRFVITSPRVPSLGRAGQYIFYRPKDMAKDHYPETDVASVDALISRLLDGLPESVVAVSISPDVIKDIGKFDDQPLFAQEISSISGTPLDLQDLLALVDSTAQAFDRQGCEFHMNLPCADQGIYLWHDYV